ncbi:hypothetical protein J132_05164, partial [Termitomyces sp. J132]
KDWVSKLPAIEFAINTARSVTTGYSPFFLNYSQMPQSLVWDSATKNEYPGMTIIATHDCILAAQVKQTCNANQKHALVPFKEEEFAYMSTENMTFPKGLTCKLIPKYVGPYDILKNFVNESCRVQLPLHMLQRDIHNVFHLSL